MQSVTIFPVLNSAGNPRFCAVTRSGHSEGATAGQALDAARDQLPADDSSTIVVIQSFRPDAFFSAEKQDRLRALMARWRASRDSNAPLLPEEAAELESLVVLEQDAAAKRAARMLEELGE